MGQRRHTSACLIIAVAIAAAAIATAARAPIGAAAAKAAHGFISAASSATALASASIDAKKKEQQNVKSQLSDVRQGILDAVGESSELNEQKDTLEGQKASSEMTYSELAQKLAYYRSEVDKANQALIDAENQLGEQRELMKSSVRAMYMCANGSAVEALLSSKDITCFLEKLELFTIINRHGKEVFEDYKAALEDVAFKQSVNMSVAVEMQEQASGELSRIAEISVTRLEIESSIEELQSEIDRLDKREAELAAQSLKLESDIKALTEKSKAAKYSGGLMRWPAPGYRAISSQFGRRMHPILKVIKTHTGIDIAAPTGASIVAAKGGTVIIAGNQGGYGKAVVIDHGGGITTLYGHCSKLLVKPGQKVKEGATIAKAGSTGVATGPHLHFEVRKNGVPVQPMDYL